MNLRQRIVALALSVTAALSLAACTGGAPEAGSLSDSPTPTESTEPSSSPDTSPSSDPSASAPVTDPANPLTPVQTVREFVRLQTVLERTGDATGFLALSDSKCAYCSGYVKTLEDLRENGGWLRGTTATVANIRAKPNEPQTDKRQVMWVTINLEAGSYKTSKDSEVVVTEKKQVLFSYVLFGNRNHWRIGSVSDVEN